MASDGENTGGGVTKICVYRGVMNRGDLRCGYIGMCIFYKPYLNKSFGILVMGQNNVMINLKRKPYIFQIILEIGLCHTKYISLIQ